MDFSPDMGNTHHPESDYDKYLITITFDSNKKGDFYKVRKTMDGIRESLMNLEGYTDATPPSRSIKQLFTHKDYSTYTDRLNKYDSHTRTRLKYCTKSDNGVHIETKMSISRLKKHAHLVPPLNEQKSDLEKILDTKKAEYADKKGFQPFEYVTVLADPTYKL